MNTPLFPPDRILVPTDFGAPSRTAMGFARILREAFGAHVDAVHAVQIDLPPYFTSDQVETLRREIKKAMKSAREMLRKEAESSLGPDVGTSVEDQQPLEAILEASVRLDSDLIIMGTHGRRGAQRLRLGSVAERVLRSSRIPVLTVRASSQPGRFKHVFCPRNFSAAGRAALNYAVEVAAITGARLTVMHAKETENSPSDCSLVDEPVRERCKVDEVIIGGEAAGAILEAAQKIRPDLIVMGAEQKTGVVGELFGSTTERVMQLAQAPLLIVPKLKSESERKN